METMFKEITKKNLNYKAYNEIQRRYLIIALQRLSSLLANLTFEVEHTPEVQKILNEIFNVLNQASATEQGFTFIFDNIPSFKDYYNRFNDSFFENYERD